MNEKSRKALGILRFLPAAVSAGLVIISFIIKYFPEGISHIYENNSIIRHSWHDTFGIVTEIIFCILAVLTLIYTVLVCSGKSSIAKSQREISLNHILSLNFAQFVVILNDDNSAVVLGTISTDDGGRNRGDYLIK